ncbi:MAG: VWA domain-containing protein, partial [Acidobacteria bacterium]
QPMIAAALRALPQTDVTVIADGEPLDSHDVVVCSRACDPPPRTAALLFAPGGVVPAIDRQESADLRTIRVAADLESSPWALTPAFPLFVADAVEWLTRRQTPALSNADVRAIAESDTRGTVAPRVDELTYATASAAPRTFWFALAALALLGILIDAFVRRRNVALRIVAAAMVGAALAGLTLPLGTSDRTAVIVADASASVAGQQRAIGERVRQETSRAVDADRADILRFGGTDTDIAAALRSARVRLPPTGDRRLLLLSDGRQTIGDGLLEARASAATGIPIDVIPIDSRVPAYIERVDAPVTTRIGAAVPIRISLRGRKDETLRLTVSRNGQALDSRRVILNDVGTGAVVITDKPMDAGVTFYRATLADERTGLTVSEAGAGVAVEGRGRVLVISERRGVFTQLIGGGPLNAVNIAPAAAPDTRETLSAFSAIVMDAVPPHRLTGRQLDAIAAAVAIDGAGLLVLGNRESLDPSEFPASAFVDSLPVDFTELSAPPSTATSLALLVDISGSMAATSDGVTKISAARDAIARALSVVPKTDAVEVIGFAAAPSVVIGPNDPRDAQSIAAKLSALSPSGTTALSPAVRDAVAWLKQTPGRRRRLLLVTDGKTSVADAEATRAAVSGQSIEVSVVTIGVDAERDWLVELAAANGGRAVFPDRLSDLARLVAREASPSGDGRDISERFVVRAGTHPLAPGPRGPTLDGYIAGRLRDGAVAAWKSQRDDAVLAAWARGLGRVAVFSSDLDGAWGQPLRSWAPNAAFWTRAIQWLARGSDLTGLDAELALSTEGPRLVVDIGRLPRLRTALPQVRASIAGPSGQTLAVMLHAVSPTRFEGAAALAEAGDYRASITVSDASVLEQRATRGWYWTGDQESQSRGMNVPLLGEIARTSGGRVLAPLGSSGESADGVFSGPRQRSRVNPMAWLLVAALALLSFDYLRRINEV